MASLEALAAELRSTAYRTILNAGSGHLGACGSSAELLATLYFGGLLRYDPDDPDHPDRDRVYLRGHLGPLRYAVFAKLGWLPEADLATYRSSNSRLKGHESMAVPGVDVTPSGSLGMLLSYAVGGAIATRNQGRASLHVVLLGDGEEQEGNVGEAARHAATEGLDNLVCILDENGKQLSRPTPGEDIETIWAGYGWRVRTLDGHDPAAITEAYRAACEDAQPSLLIARTVKGRGLAGSEAHFNGYHTISAVKDHSTIRQALSDEHHEPDLDLIQRPTRTNPAPEPIRHAFTTLVDPDDDTNLDHAQGRYFTELKRRGLRVYFLTPDFLNSDAVEHLGLTDYAYHDVGIREQHAVAMAHGLSQHDPGARIFLNYGDAFTYRAADQLNAAAQGGSRLILMMEMAGLSQGQNGSTHQPAGSASVPLFIPDVHHYEPADVQDLYNALDHAFGENPGVVTIRSHRADIAPLAPVAERTLTSYVVHDAARPELTLVGSGLAVPGLVAAARLLEREGRPARVINAVNPRLDETFARMVVEGRPLLTAYNGHPDLLAGFAASAILAHDGPRPSSVHGHGYRLGDTGRIPDLLRQYRLDGPGLAEVARAL